jgi:hypothetical protein
MFGHTQQSGASRVRRALAALCAVVLVAGLAGPAFGESAEFTSQLPAENATSNPVVDVMLLRPIGLAAFVTGTALFIPAGVLTLMTRPQEIDVPFGYLVVAPARYVWADELGKH